MTGHRLLLRLQGTLPGEEVRPDTVHVLDMLDVLERFTRAVMLTSGCDPEADQCPRISLLQIDEGSCVAVLDHDAALDSSADAVAWAIRDRDVSGIPSAAHQELDGLSRKVASRSWTLGLSSDRWQGPEDEPTKEVVLSELHPVPALPRAAAPLRVRGDTTVKAAILGVKWDRKPTLWMRPAGATRTIEATTASLEVARRFGEMVRKHALISGEATWDPADWRLATFEVRSVRPLPDSTGLLDAFAELREAMGGVWDEGDVVETVREMREDDEELPRRGGAAGRGLGPGGRPIVSGSGRS